MSVKNHIKQAILGPLSEKNRMRLRFARRHLLPHYLPQMLRFQMARLFGGPKFPVELTVFITNRCNARCKHCFYIDELGDTTGEFTVQDWEQLGRTLPERMDLLTLTGGEALLQGDLPAIAEVLCRRAMPRVLTVISNGLRPDAVSEFVDVWLEMSDREFGDKAPVLDLLVSLDGLEQTHNEVRGHADAWQNGNETIRRVARLRDDNPGRVDVGVITVITERNWQELEPLAHHVREKLGVRQGFEFIRGSATSVWGMPQDFSCDFNPKGLGLPPLDKLDEIVETLRRINHAAGQQANYEFFLTNVLSARMLQGNLTKTVPCVAAGHTTAVIYPDGSIAACEFMKPFGNLKTDFDMDFNRAWHSPALRKCREVGKRCRCTHGCYLARDIALTPRGLLTLWREL